MEDDVSEKGSEMDAGDKRPVVEVSDHDHFWMDGIRRQMIREGRGSKKLREAYALIDAQAQAEGDPESKQLKPLSKRPPEPGDGPEGESRQYRLVDVPASLVLEERLSGTHSGAGATRRCLCGGRTGQDSALWA